MTKSTPTTTTDHAPYFAPRPSWIQGQVIIHENDHGPLPDVVTTQGQQLVAQPHTPVFPPLSSETQSFATELAASLSALISRQNRRRLGYGIEAAEEWPIGRTPPEVRRAQRERLRAKLRASLEEDSESDIEATLDLYYPLPPVSPASQGSSFPRLAIDSKSAFPPLDNQIDSESDVRGEKKKHIEGDSGHLSYTKYKRVKVDEVKVDEGSFIVSGVFANEDMLPRRLKQQYSAESCGVTHAGYGGNGTVEKMFSEGEGPDGATAPISSPKTMDGSSLQRVAQRYSSPINSIP